MANSKRDSEMLLPDSDPTTQKTYDCICRIPTSVLSPITCHHQPFIYTKRWLLLCIQTAAVQPATTERTVDMPTRPSPPTPCYWVAPVLLLAWHSAVEESVPVREPAAKNLALWDLTTVKLIICIRRHVSFGFPTRTFATYWLSLLLHKNMKLNLII